MNLGQKPMDDREYEIEDLVKHPYFKKAVLSPDDQSEAYWEKWKSASDINGEKYDQARLIVIALHELYSHQIPEEEISQNIDNIHKIRQNSSQKDPIPLSRWNLRWIAAAALVFVATAATWIFFKVDPDWTSSFVSDDIPTISNLTLPEGVSEADQNIVRINDTASQLTLMLSDSSVVTLLPGSRLEFPARFTSGERKVLLTGDAYFEVTSSPDRPFLVYAMDAVVKVLGTSFRVITQENENRVTVKVISGRVSVYNLADYSSREKVFTSPSGGVMLVGNEEVVVNTAARTIRKSTVDFPATNKSKQRFRELIFDDTPISEVFNEMARTYGMEIEFDERAFSACPITTYFKEETLLERINTICEAVGATYRPEQGKIIITGIDCTGL